MMSSFDLDVKGFAALRTGAVMLALDFFEPDMGAAGGTSTIYMGFSVFPFVLLQQEKLAYFSRPLFVKVVFRRSFRDVFGKYPIKDKNEQKQGNHVDDNPRDKVRNEYRAECDDEIDDDEELAEFVKAVSAVHEGSELLFHGRDVLSLMISYYATTLPYPNCEREMKF
jgi:hypothetical protein